MPPTRRRPQDFTGREADRLAKERDAAAARDAAELTMITQAEQEEKDETVVDYVERPQEAQPSGPVEVRQPHRTVRINMDLEKVTYGAGNHYDFEAGRTYRLPSDLADHLDAKGFVWH